MRAWVFYVYLLLFSFAYCVEAHALPPVALCFSSLLVEWLVRFLRLDAVLLFVPRAPVASRLLRCLLVEEQRLLDLVAFAFARSEKAREWPTQSVGVGWRNC